MKMVWSGLSTNSSLFKPNLRQVSRLCFTSPVLLLWPLSRSVVTVVDDVSEVSNKVVVFAVVVVRRVMSSTSSLVLVMSRTVVEIVLAVEVEGVEDTTSSVVDFVVVVDTGGCDGFSGIFRSVSSVENRIPSSFSFSSSSEGNTMPGTIFIAVLSVVEFAALVLSTVLVDDRAVVVIDVVVVVAFVVVVVVTDVVVMVVLVVVVVVVVVVTGTSPSL
jgi:hypothetical protein